MNPKEKLSRDDFPDELREQFAVVERRLWKVETTMAVSYTHLTLPTKA